MRTNSRTVSFAVLTLTTVALALAGCPPKGGPLKQVAPKEVEGLLRNDFAVLIDVREPEELAETGLAAKAVSIPMSRIRAGDEAWKSFLATTPKDKQLIFYCRSGRRAMDAAVLAEKEGFRVANMGGFESWKEAGLPVVRP